MHCKRCGLWVAYEPTDASPYVYLVDGALVRNQSDAHTMLQLESERRKEELATMALQQAAEQNPLALAQATASVMADMGSAGSARPAP